MVGGLALEISSFVGPCEMARADRRVPFHENALITLWGPLSCNGSIGETGGGGEGMGVYCRVQ